MKNTSTKNASTCLAVVELCNIVKEGGTKQWHNVSNIHNARLYRSTNFLNAPRKTRPLRILNCDRQDSENRLQRVCQYIADKNSHVHTVIRQLWQANITKCCYKSARSCCTAAGSNRFVSNSNSSVELSLSSFWFSSCVTLSQQWLTEHKNSTSVQQPLEYFATAVRIRLSYIKLAFFCSADLFLFCSTFEHQPC